jgi:outer membrane lipoprotein-sorting protein
MNFLRRLSTLRLLLLSGGLVALVLVATGVTIASRSGGPKPPHRTLPAALRHALEAQPVAGVSARIRFTNHLLSGASLPDTGSTLISGASGRLWATKDRLRLELQSDSGDTELVLTSSGATLYDASSNTAYRLPFAHHSTSSKDASRQKGGLPTLDEISRLVARAARSANLSGAIPTSIAGRPAYTVRIAPKHDGGLLGSVQLAWDADHGVPLRIAVYSSTDRSPVLELKVTDIHYGAVPASTFDLKPPSGARVTTVELPSRAELTSTSKKIKHIEGVRAVAATVPFTLRAPTSLVGLPRRTVRAISGAGARGGALVVYGRGLGAIAVVERAASGSASSGSPLSALPAVSIHGASGRELATPLGTVLTWQRGGVSYTLIGSLPASAAEAAARALTP